MLAAITGLRSGNCSLVDTEVIAVDCKNRGWAAFPPGREIKHDGSRVPRPHSDRTARARAEEAWQDPSEVDTRKPARLELLRGP